MIIIYEKSYLARAQGSRLSLAVGLQQKMKSKNLSKLIRKKFTFSVSVVEECCNVAGLGSELMLT